MHTTKRYILFIIQDFISKWNKNFLNIKTDLFQESALEISLGLNLPLSHFDKYSPLQDTLVPKFLLLQQSFWVLSHNCPLPSLSRHCNRLPQSWVRAIHCFPIARLYFRITSIFINHKFLFQNGFKTFQSNQMAEKWTCSTLEQRQDWMKLECT